MDENRLVEMRLSKSISYLKKNYNLIVYLLLAVIVFISVKLRTLNLSKLRDITTGGWTLGPDLDPFLFLRWSKELLANGSIASLDTMRYVPLGFETSSELFLHSHMIVWFHSLASFFGSTSIEHSAALYPVFMFALTVIAFYLMVHKIFQEFMGDKAASVTGLVASLFLAILPPILPRTIAGIPEKESGAFLFMFLAIYFFVFAWKSSDLKKAILFGALSGLSTAVMAMIWGGYTFVFVTIGAACLVSFLAGKVELRHSISYICWIVLATVIPSLVNTRYTLIGFLTSITTGVAFVTLFVILVDLIVKNTSLGEKISKGWLSKIPSELRVLLVSFVAIILMSSLLFGPLFIFEKIDSVKNTLMVSNVDRLGLTVAENKQPYFSEWAYSFGPVLNFGKMFSNFALFFWVFFLGSIYLFYHSLNMMRIRERAILTFSYAFFLVALVFSRYSPDSIFNGTNLSSVLFYFLGVVVLFGSSIYFYLAYYREEKRNLFDKMDSGLILAFVLFFLTIVGARGAIRLVMLLVPSAAMIAAFFLVSTLTNSFSFKDGGKKVIYFVMALMVLFAMGYSAIYFYNSTKITAENYAPSIYTHQWQLAMSWVRDNTSTNAVFGHWWDYGYWVQSIGERATVLDGGNSIPYWNHMMGRYALTGYDNQKALEFLYAHNTTHFLIDSTDIGKYGAFSSIGSDKNYDRMSFIPSLSKNEAATQETKNSTVFVYDAGAGIGLDQDIIYSINGTDVLIARGKSALRAIYLTVDKNDGQINFPPVALFLSQLTPSSPLRQYSIPLRFLYFNNNLLDFQEGLESGIVLVPKVEQSGQGLSISKNGAAIYLSNRTAMSQLARLYFYNESINFKLAHSEDDYVVSQLKSQGAIDEDFVYFQGEIRGPIKIWEIDYPKDIEFNKEYLETAYPEEILYA